MTDSNERPLDQKPGDVLSGPGPESSATTAGEEDHTDADDFRGEDADAPK